jgi:hypothetical protein
MSGANSPEMGDILAYVEKLEAELERLRGLVGEAFEEAALDFYSKGLTDGHDMGIPWRTDRLRGHIAECWLESDTRAALNPETNQ